jgi:hypothetical protein
MVWELTIPQLKLKGYRSLGQTVKSSRLTETQTASGNRSIGKRKLLGLGDGFLELALLEMELCA